jgi:hypothetical protein
MKNEQVTRKRTYVFISIYIEFFFQMNWDCFCFFFSSQRQTNKYIKWFFFYLLWTIIRHWIWRISKRRTKEKTHSNLIHSLTHAEKWNIYQPAIQASLRRRRRTIAYRICLYGSSIIPDGRTRSTRTLEKK